MGGGQRGVRSGDHIAAAGLYDQDPNDVRARRALAAVLFRQGFLLHYNLKKPQQAIAPLREASRLWSLDTDPEQYICT